MTRLLCDVAFSFARGSVLARRGDLVIDCDDDQIDALDAAETLLRVDIHRVTPDVLAGLASDHAIDTTAPN